MHKVCVSVALACGLTFAGQEPPAAPRVYSPASPSAQETHDRTLKDRSNDPLPTGPYAVPPGTQMLLTVLSSVSSTAAQVGDRVYLKTAFPVAVGGRIVIPEGSYVSGTVSAVKRPARGRKPGELQMQFDSIVLPNGVYRDFHGNLNSLDDRDEQKLNRESGQVNGKRGGDASTVVVPTVIGGSAGSIAGAVTNHPGMGAAIGVGAGAALGTALFLTARGGNARLEPGTSVQMILSVPLTFTESEIDFRNSPATTAMPVGRSPAQQKTGWSKLPL